MSQNIGYSKYTRFSRFQKISSRISVYRENTSEDILVKQVSNWSMLVTNFGTIHGWVRPNSSCPDRPWKLRHFFIWCCAFKPKQPKTQNLWKKLILGKFCNFLVQIWLPCSVRVGRVSSMTEIRVHWCQSWEPVKQRIHKYSSPKLVPSPVSKNPTPLPRPQIIN